MGGARLTEQQQQIVTESDKGTLIIIPIMILSVNFARKKHTFHILKDQH